MNTPLFSFALFSTLLASALASAQAEERHCPESQQQYGALQVNISQWCGLDVTTADWASKRYRTYSFNTEGGLMIFVRTDDSERLSRATGSRTFFLAPRTPDTEPRVTDVGTTDEGEGTIRIVGPAGQSAVFSTVTAQMLSLDGYDAKVASEITLANQGGVELKARPGSILIDTNWKTGGTGYDQNRSTALSPITDGAGRSCKVKNTQLFRYADGEGHYRFKTDAQLAEFLKTSCPSLDRSRL